MKHKSLICLTFVFIVVFSVFSVTTRLINAVNAPVLSVVLSGSMNTYSIPAQAVGSTFKVDVCVDDLSSVIPGVNSVSYSLTWDPTVLWCISKTDNTWLPSQSNMGDLPFNNTSGIVTIGQVAFDISNAEACTTVSNVSATFAFKVVSAGSCIIGLQPSVMGVPYLSYPDSQGKSHAVIGTTTVNATYDPVITTSSSVHGPTAEFTPTAGSSFKIDSSIMLNANLSQPGYDTQTCPITNYAWSVEYLNGTTFASFTGETATFDAAVGGTFRIVLIVTAKDVENPPSPTYVSTNSASALIRVVSIQQSANIDVFTDREGTSEGVSGGAYGPLQVVRAYALVTFDNASMPGENVMFTILDANGSSYYRLGVTNESGIATIQPSFRLPAPNFDSPQTGFGTWSITASADFLGVTMSDTTNFTFGYLSAIENVTLPSTINRNEVLPIQLTINNQELSTQLAQLSVTLFDQADEPIGSSTLTVTQQTQEITILDAAITIPSWAFTGQATAYLCLLTNSSLPLAPESVANFNILL
jgi:hypothetical protein